MITDFYYLSWTGQFLSSIDGRSLIIGPFSLRVPF